MALERHQGADSLAHGAQLIRDTCLVGTADELVERVRALEQDGLRELIFATGTGAKWRLAEDFARQVVARL